jgi:hypothetical protein
MSGFTGTQVEELYALGASVTKNTYTTEAAFSGVAGTNTVCTLPAGYFLNNTPTPNGTVLSMTFAGQGLTTSKNRKATNTPSVSGQMGFERKYSGTGNDPVFPSTMTIQPMKQAGIAAGRNARGTAFSSKLPTPHLPLPYP